MKYKLFAAIILALSLAGCDPIYKYVPDNSDSYKIADRQVIYENDTLKLAVSSDYMQYSIERHTELTLVIYAKCCDLHADFNKIELYPDIPIQREYISYIEGEGPTDEKGWVLKKGKEYHYYIYFTTVHGFSLTLGSRIHNVKVNLAKVFQYNNKQVHVPEFYFASEK